MEHYSKLILTACQSQMSQVATTSRFIQSPESCISPQRGTNPRACGAKAGLSFVSEGSLASVFDGSLFHYPAVTPWQLSKLNLMRLNGQIKRRGDDRLRFKWGAESARRSILLGLQRPVLLGGWCLAKTGHLKSIS